MIQESEAPPSPPSAVARANFLETLSAHERRHERVYVYHPAAPVTAFGEDPKWKVTASRQARDVAEADASCLIVTGGIVVGVDLDTESDTDIFEFRVDVIGIKATRYKGRVDVMLTGAPEHNGNRRFLSDFAREVVRAVTAEMRAEEQRREYAAAFTRARAKRTHEESEDR